MKMNLSFFFLKALVSTRTRRIIWLELLSPLVSDNYRVIGLNLKLKNCHLGTIPPSAVITVKFP